VSSDIGIGTEFSAPALCTGEQVRKAQRAAARNAKGESELVMFLHMLGVFPGQPNALRTYNQPR
jgi:hypothetical protein